jgi:uncharacterized protein (TIGR03435 family)
MLRIAAIAFIAVSTLVAQSFEVASVKRSTPETGSGARSTGAIPRQQETGRINYPNVKLKSVIALAYGVAPDQISGPQWLDDERYDIVATLPAGASQDQIPMMLQHLLTERFAMMIHEETKPRAGYALEAGKGALQLKASKETGDDIGFAVSSDHVQFTNFTMAQVANFLGSSMGRPVADQTGIEGRFDITLNASMADIKSGSVSGAIEDLGLKLSPRSALAKFVVIDKADKIPTVN